ncbi:MAG: hypothetical protein HQ511_00100 [Rhodospirillales bacterium]|nr:hypothetical protein [Rhodospirillales bacterium]
MPDMKVCDSALAWPGGGQPYYADGGYGGMFASEAVGRGLSVSTCANMLLASLGGASDQYICGRAVSWSDLEQVPYWSNYAGIYRYIAGSRGFVPIDCHDSNFECLDHGFSRGSDTFKQCRLQLIVARREDARIRLAVEAAEAEAAEYEHHRRERIKRRHDDMHRQEAHATKQKRHTLAQTKPTPAKAKSLVPRGKAAADFRKNLDAIHKDHQTYTDEQQRKIDRIINPRPR